MHICKEPAKERSDPYERRTRFVDAFFNRPAVHLLVSSSQPTNPVYLMNHASLIIQLKCSNIQIFIRYLNQHESVHTIRSTITIDSVFAVALTMSAQSMRVCPESFEITSSAYCPKPFLDLICLRILNAFASLVMSVLDEKNKSPITMKQPACVHDERLE